MARWCVVLALVLAVVSQASAIPPKGTDKNRSGSKPIEDVLHLQGTRLLMGSLGASKLIWDDGGGGGGFGIGIDYLYFVNPRLALGGQIERLKLGDNRNTYSGDDVSSSVTPLIARGYFTYPLEMGLIPYWSVGGGFYRVSHSGKGYDWVSDSKVPFSESGFKIGLNVSGGAMIQAKEDIFFGVESIIHAFFDEPDGELVVFDFRIRAGKRF